MKFPPKNYLESDLRYWIICKVFLGQDKVELINLNKEIQLLLKPIEESEGQIVSPDNNVTANAVKVNFRIIVLTFINPITADSFPYTLLGLFP